MKRTCKLCGTIANVYTTIEPYICYKCRIRVVNEAKLLENLKADNKRLIDVNVKLKKEFSKINRLNWLKKTLNFKKS